MNTNENDFLPKAIDTTNLEIGMIAKNYKELCNLLNEPIKDGNSKKFQLKEWARYFEFEKQKWKQSYIILDIYDEPLEKEDNRKKGNNSVYSNEEKKYKEFNVPKEYVYMPGVYKIENDQYIYIGSTTLPLCRRFSQHYHNSDGNHNKTQKVLLNNGTFTNLEVFPQDTKEKIIRDAEANYIRKFQDSDKILLNSNLPELVKKKKSKTISVNKVKYKTIKVPMNIIDEFQDALRLSGFLLMNNTIYDKQFTAIIEE